MTDNRTPDQIEREIEAERDALARSLGNLQHTLSPDRLMHQATDYVRENGGDLADRLLSQVKANPMAAAVTGVGIAWLLASSSRTASKPDANTYDREAATHDPRYIADFKAPGGRPAPSYAAPQGRPAAGYDDRAYDKAPGALSQDPYSPAYDTRLGQALREEEAAASGDLRGQIEDFAEALSDDAKDAYAKATAELTRFYEQARARVEGGVTSDGPSGGKDDGPSLWDSVSARLRGLSVHLPDDARRSFDTAVDNAETRIAQARTRARLAGAEARYEVEQKARQGAGAMRSRAADLRARLAEGTEGMSEAARQRVIRARQVAADAQGNLEQAKAKTVRAYDDQPLLGGLLAAALGAAIGTLLPRTQTEDHYLGAYRDRAFDEADRIFREEVSRLRAVGDASMDEARAAAHDYIDGERSTPRATLDRVTKAAREEAERQKLGQPLN